MTATKRHTGYDLLRFLSICMVVMIHANVSFLGQNHGTASWMAVMLLTALCAVSVPLFFMLSGALLLAKEEPTSLKDLYGKRIPKQAIPFVLWSIIYVVARMVMGKIPVSFGGFVSLLWEPAYYQFWFMYTLLGIYLILPLLQTLVKHLDKRMLEYALAIWAVFAILVPTASYIAPQFQISGHVDLIVGEGYLGYFLLGHYLQTYGKEISKKKTLFALLVGLILLLGCAAGEWFVEGESAYQGDFYRSYLTPGVVLTAGATFLLLQNSNIALGVRGEKITATLSANALGIYYIHMLVLTALEYFVTKGETVFQLVAKIAIVLIASFVASFVLQRVPLLNRLLLGVSKKKRSI